MQRAPKRVNQTLATKVSALEFGLAAICAKTIREVFHNVYEEYDGYMVRRLTATIAACIRTSDNDAGARDLHDGDLSLLKGFTFNTAAPFERLVAVSPTLEVVHNGTIHFQMPLFIPKEDVVYPSNLLRPNGCFGIYIVAFSFRDGRVHIIDYAGFDVAYDESNPREINWTCSKRLPKGYIVLVIFGLRYFSLNWLKQRVQTTDKDFYPTIVLDAFHVTDEMATLGIEDNLEEPSEKNLSGLETIEADSLKREIAKLKKKAAKK